MVQVGRGLVQDEYAGSGDQGPRQGHPGTLSAGEGGTPLPHGRTETVGESGGEDIDAAGPDGAVQHVRRGVGGGQQQVLGEGAVEEGGFLADDGDGAA